ncbi:MULTISPECIES: hypothetical protein [Streptomyces]|uniref:hypothetical protein n=1 Tax=Streptomyces lycopersici TaxID=2974589 RepID=UPI0021D290ED|nr:hypothetical protein [Streptomyces sp. NEAU-383]
MDGHGKSMASGFFHRDAELVLGELVLPDGGTVLGHTAAGAHDLDDIRSPVRVAAHHVTDGVLVGDFSAEGVRVSSWGGQRCG